MEGRPTGLPPLCDCWDMPRKTKCALRQAERVLSIRLASVNNECRRAVVVGGRRRTRRRRDVLRLALTLIASGVPWSYLVEFDSRILVLTGLHRLSRIMYRPESSTCEVYVMPQGYRFQELGMSGGVSTTSDTTSERSFKMYTIVFRLV